LEQATKTYFNNCLISAKDIGTASSFQPWCGVEWLNLSLNVSKKLQSIKSVFTKFYRHWNMQPKVISEIA
jgi:hypothetical protein